MKEKKNEKSTEKKKIDSQTTIYVSIGIVLLIIIGFVILKFVNPDIITLGGKKDNEVGGKEDPIIQQPVIPEGPQPSEETVVEEFGMEMQEAIDIVKEIFNSDNYKFEAKVSAESEYIVTVTDEVTKEKMVFIVNPANKTYTMQQ